MPRLITKIEGKGNGIRTNLVNLADIAKELRVPTQYPLKFMGHELGSQTIYREKGNEITSLIQGSWYEELPTLLDKFIEKYVLCPKCKLPEISIKINKGGIVCNCRACGAECDLDNKHKVAPFIIKNPPKNIKGDIETNDTKDLELTKQLKEDKKKKQESMYGAEKLKVDGQLWKKMQKVVNKHFVEDCQLPKGVETYEGNDKAVNHLYQLMKKCKIQKSLKDRHIFIFFNSIFDMNIAKQVERNSYLLSKYFQKLKISQNDAQLHLLATLEYFLLVIHEEQKYGEKNYIPTILTYFFEEGFFTSSFILDWAKGNKVNVMKKNNFAFNEETDEKFKEFAAQFIEFAKWKQEDGDEQEDDEGDDEEEEEDNGEGEGEENEDEKE